MQLRMFVLSAVLVMSASLAFAQGADKKVPAKPMAAKSAMADKLMAAENKMLDDLTRHDKDAFFAVIAPTSWSVDEGGWTSLDDFRKTWD